MTTRLSDWFRPRPHDEPRSIDLVRFAVAILVATHAVHALIHHDDLRSLAGALDTRGLPFALPASWLVAVVGLITAVGLAVRRFVIPASVSALGLVGAGALLLHAPRWYVIGGTAVDGHPGVELDVLTMACLVGVLWTYRAAGETDRRLTAKQGFDVIRIASAFALLMHGSVFVTWDFASMRAFGDSMTAAGWPHGLVLVWSIKIGEFVSALLRLARRLVVPACFVHLSYIVPALWIEHEMNWFDVGPGENGIEFPLLIVVCTIACILAYWPGRRTAPSPSSTALATSDG